MSKTILTDEQKNQVINFIKLKPDMSAKEIADILNVPFESVRSFKSHVSMGTYDKIVNEDDAVDYEISLSMERDLQTFLLDDLNQIEPGLTLYEKGREFTIDIGRIDILALDKNNDFVVIELKAGTAQDKALGQLLGYMGYVAEKLSNGKNVRGYLIANDFDDRVKYAIKIVKNVILKTYSVNFFFVDIG